MKRRSFFPAAVAAVASVPLFGKGHRGAAAGPSTPQCLAAQCIGGPLAWDWVSVLRASFNLVGEGAYRIERFHVPLVHHSPEHLYNITFKDELFYVHDSLSRNAAFDVIFRYRTK